jgi:hypothetical protein
MRSGLRLSSIGVGRPAICFATARPTARVVAKPWFEHPSATDQSLQPWRAADEREEVDDEDVDSAEC